MTCFILSHSYSLGRGLRMLMVFVVCLVRPLGSYEPVVHFTAVYKSCTLVIDALHRNASAICS